MVFHFLLGEARLIDLVNKAGWAQTRRPLRNRYGLSKMRKRFVKLFIRIRKPKWEIQEIFQKYLDISVLASGTRTSLDGTT